MDPPFGSLVLLCALLLGSIDDITRSMHFYIPAYLRVQARTVHTGTKSERIRRETQSVMMHRGKERKRGSL